MSIVVATVVAHQGGWDEILLVGAPIVAIVAMLVVVKRRVDAQLPVESAPGPGPTEQSPTEQSPT